MNKKILIFSIAYYPFVGGAEIAVKEITDRIKDIEWHMVTCALGSELPHEEKIGNVYVHRIVCSKFLFPVRACMKGLQLHSKFHFDAIWSIMASYAGFATLFFTFWKKIPFLLTLQEGDPIVHIKRKVWFIYPLFRSIFKRANYIQAISNFLASFGRDMGAKVPIEVISNGVDIECFSHVFTEKEKLQMRQTLDKKDGDIFLVTSSRLVKKNAIDDIITALTLLPDYVYLIVIGKGVEGVSLQVQAKKLGVDNRVKFVGFISQGQIPFYFSACDIFVRPSRSEGFGNSFIEAMAAHVPVVATPVGGIPDFIDDKETGLFCAPDNPTSLAQTIRLLIDDSVLREHIIEVAFKKISLSYSWDIVAHDMKERVFDRLLYE